MKKSRAKSKQTNRKSLSIFGYKCNVFLSFILSRNNKVVNTVYDKIIQKPKKKSEPKKHNFSLSNMQIVKEKKNEYIKHRQKIQFACLLAWRRKEEKVEEDKEFLRSLIWIIYFFYVFIRKKEKFINFTSSIVIFHICELFKSFTSFLHYPVSNWKWSQEKVKCE